MSLFCFRPALAALALLAAPCAQAIADDPTPVTVVTHFDIIPAGGTPDKNVVQATALMKQFVLDSRADPGVISFTLITWAPTGNHFQMLEVFDSLDAFNRHVAAAHSITFRTALQPLIGSPLDERRYTENKRGDHH